MTSNVTKWSVFQNPVTYTVAMYLYLSTFESILVLYLNPSHRRAHVLVCT